MGINDPVIGADDPRPRRAPGLAPAQPEVATPVVAQESSMERAKRRAAELLEHGALDEGPDEFYINPALIPEGWSYEWKRHSVLGALDPAYEVQVAKGGWEPVPASRHADMMPTHYDGNTILRKGMILMERPLEITLRARQRDQMNARNQVRQKEAQLTGAPAGDNSPFDPTNKGASLVKISKSYEPMVIPEK
jgi:hypothetical protein